ncbi:glycosyltransferase [Aquirufa sp. OSTEICH-129V]|uniref:Glycosyltransferase n=1 Tax=Aquirufa avitistagni TaxID=3104728 RepID=A0ABW6DD47_9BACT
MSKALNIVLLSYHNQNGGAGIAAGRLQQALQKAGHQVTYLVQEKSGDDGAELIRKGLWAKLGNWIRFILERLYFLPSEKSKSIRFLFNPGLIGQDISRHPAIQQADIIHLHWVNFGFLSISNIEQLLKLGKPVIWTLHDMWAFTGGCHHSGDCENFQTNCGSCKFVNKPERWDISHRMWARKIFAFEYPNLHIITCSEWLKSRAEKSTILAHRSIESIPNALDTEFFQRISDAKNTLQLNPMKQYILFVAMRVNTPTKGFSYLKEALEIWKKENPATAKNTELLLVGNVIDSYEIKALPLPATSLGHIADPSKMRLIYSAADVFITPSLEENLPNTIMEAMACGTPCVGFHVGGIPEMIDHEVNGFVAEYLSANELASGIQWSLNHTPNEAARDKVISSYQEDIIAQKHSELYFKYLPDGQA